MRKNTVGTHSAHRAALIRRPKQLVHTGSPPLPYVLKSRRGWSCSGCPQQPSSSSDDEEWTCCSCCCRFQEASGGDWCSTQCAWAAMALTTKLDSNAGLCFESAKKARLTRLRHPDATKATPTAPGAHAKRSSNSCCCCCCCCWC